MTGQYEPLSFAGPKPDEDRAAAVTKIYEYHIAGLKEWARRRLLDNRPVSPQELVDQINVRFPAMEVTLP